MYLVDNTNLLMVPSICAVPRPFYSQAREPVRFSMPIQNFNIPPPFYSQAQEPVSFSPPIQDFNVPPPFYSPVQVHARLSPPTQDLNNNMISRTALVGWNQSSSPYTMNGSPLERCSPVPNDSVIMRHDYLPFINED